MNVVILLIPCFLLRFALSLTTFNHDIWNHEVWMDSVRQFGWQGLYDRDVSPWAIVNYPPLALYSFAVGEGIYQRLPATLQTEFVRASLYKFPSILADCLIAFLIWRFTPFSRRAKLVAMSAFLFNPALIYNSVFWGQIESLSALTAIITILALVKKRPDLALIAFVVGLLTKQNILPLAPLLLAGFWFSPIPAKRLASSAVISASLCLVAYAPLTPRGSSGVGYIFSTYLSSIGGQLHQHLGSVNALNFWYLLGFNQIGDTGIRLWSNVLTCLGVGFNLVVLFSLRRRPFVAYFTSASLLTLWTFVFTTRMHERHGYLALALLTFLLPEGYWRWPYVILSSIGFYNLYAVWAEHFAIPPSPLWSSTMFVLSGITVLTTLGSVTLAFLQQRQHESHHNSHDQ